jgi:SagB-type dehydrogenase family enzyme
MKTKVIKSVALMFSLFIPITFWGQVQVTHSDTILKTGWYYVSNQETDFKRQLDKSSEFYYINPDVKVPVEQFEELNIVENEYNGTKYTSLIIRFNKNGTENWSNVTKESIGNRIALIIDNKLVSVPRVNAQITTGASSLNNPAYTKEELEDLLKQIGIIDKYIYLPSPQFDGLVSVEKALHDRRSRRDFQDKEISLEHLSQILWAAYGITLPNTVYPFLRGGFRTAPSAGGLYPFEIYIVVGKVQGLVPGLYKYIPNGHKIMSVINGDVRSEVYVAALEQPMVKEAPISIIYTAVFSRTTDKYGQRGRERYVCIDLGHSAENIYLQVEALGLGTCASAAFSDEKMSTVLQLPKEEEPLYIMPIGHNNKQNE